MTTANAITHSPDPIVVRGRKRLTEAELLELHDFIVNLPYESQNMIREHLARIIEKHQRKEVGHE